MAPARAAAGFSLAELLVATAVLGVLLAGLLAVLQSGLGAYRWGADRVEAQQSVRIALDRMIRELREAGYDPTGAGIAPVTVAEPARVTFQRDLDGDGVVDPTRERVTFLLRPAEDVLRRAAGGGAQPVIAGVRAFRLTYFDRLGQQTTDPGQVTAIRIELEAGRAGPAAVVESHVTLRNARR